jgi:branched-chain amino acid transport system substrate-binding protein
MPKLGAGQYNAEISAILSSGAEIVHSSFWGGDLEALILQGAPRNLFKNSTVILTAGETATHRQASQLPDGTVIGARGPNGVFAPANPLNSWFRDNLRGTRGAELPLPTWCRRCLPPKPPTGRQRGHLGRGGLHGAHRAASTASEREDESRQGPPGTRGRLRLGETGWRQVTVVDIRRYPPDKVNPPDGVKAEDWIKAGFKGQ